ncbi:unnamed protein product [Prunus armeniaca]
MEKIVSRIEERWLFFEVVAMLQAIIYAQLKFTKEGNLKRANVITGFESFNLAEEDDEEAHVEIINGDADDEYEDEVVEDGFGDEEDEEEDEDAEEEAEENFKFIDFDYEQTKEEVDKGVDEDNSWFDRHVVDENVEEAHVKPGDVPSDEYNLANLISLSEEEQDEDGVVRKVRCRRKAPRFKQFRDLINPMFELGIEFPSLEQCREAIRYYVVTSARPLKWVRNDPHRVRVTCSAGENVVQKGEQVGNGGNGEQIRNCENGEDSGNGENDEGQIVKCDWLLYTSHVGKWTTTTTKTYHPKHVITRT